GIFAIGDIATYPGKLKLILCGFSEAAMAAHAIYPLVHPGEALHFEYSTTQGVPGAGGGRVAPVPAVIAGASPGDLAPPVTDARVKPGHDDKNMDARVQV